MSHHRGNRSNQSRQCHQDPGNQAKVLETMGQLEPTMSNESFTTQDKFRKIYMVCIYWSLNKLIVSRLSNHSQTNTKNEIHNQGHF